MEQLLNRELAKSHILTNIQFPLWTANIRNNNKLKPNQVKGIIGTRDKYK